MYTSYQLLTLHQVGEYQKWVRHLVNGHGKWGTNHDQASNGFRNRMDLQTNPDRFFASIFITCHNILTPGRLDYHNSLPPSSSAKSKLT